MPLGSFVTWHISCVYNCFFLSDGTSIITILCVKIYLACLFHTNNQVFCISGAVHVGKVQETRTGLNNWNTCSTDHEGFANKQINSVGEVKAQTFVVGNTIEKCIEGISFQQIFYNQGKPIIIPGYFLEHFMLKLIIRADSKLL